MKKFSIILSVIFVLGGILVGCQKSENKSEKEAQQAMNLSIEKYTDKLVENKTIENKRDLQKVDKPDKVSDFDNYAAVVKSDQNTVSISLAVNKETKFVEQVTLYITNGDKEPYNEDTKDLLKKVIAIGVQKLPERDIQNLVDKLNPKEVGTEQNLKDNQINYSCVKTSQAVSFTMSVSK